MAGTKKTATTSWGRRVWHEATLPSGQVVELRIPGMTELIRNESVPERLRAIALKATAHPGGLRGALGDELKKANDKEAAAEEKAAEKPDEADGVERLSPELQQAIDDVAAMQKFLIAENVRVDGISPTLRELDSDEIPAPDKELLGMIMLRETAYDARGVRLGVEPLDTFERFRHWHDCAPDCGACAAVQNEFSTADLGVV